MDSSVFVLPSLLALTLSAQGITLSAKTMKANIKATIFIGCKGKGMFVYADLSKFAALLQVGFVRLQMSYMCGGLLRFGQINS